MKKSLITGMLILLLSPFVRSQTPAFPGAEGHGRYTTGGRGGDVYYVNSLSDENTGDATTKEGTLRWCLNQVGTKTILFKVSGTIFLNSNLTISRPNTTIAGQSAPGDGICIAGYPVSIGAGNVIIRFVRMRMGDGLNTGSDGADALGARKVKNIIIDHCSMSWSTDECVSIYENENTSLQWNIISESLRLSSHSKGAHGYGGIWGGVNASFHHNLFAHHDSRTPRFGPGTSTQLRELTDMRNCVIYNWTGNGCYGAEAMKVNIVNNFYKPGPGTPSGSKRGRIVAIDKKINLSSTDGFYPINNKFGQFFIDGNVVDGSTSSGSNLTVCNNATANNWDYGAYNQFASQYGTVSAAEKAAMKVATPFDAGFVSTHTAAKAYEKVLAYAGASLSRDTYDQRIVTETSNGTAPFKGLSPSNVSPYPKPGIIDSQYDLKPAGAGDEWSPWPTLQQTEAPVDTNRDGIPDGWLESNYPGKTSTDINEEGYTYLELYLNSLVQHIITQQNQDAIVSSVDTAPVVAGQLKTWFDNNGNLIVYAEHIIHNIEVYNLSGICVHSQQSGRQEEMIPFTRHSQGVYIVRVYMEGESFPSINRIIYT